MIVLERGQFWNHFLGKSLSVNTGTLRADLNDVRGASNWTLGKNYSFVTLSFSPYNKNIFLNISSIHCSILLEYLTVKKRDKDYSIYCIYYYVIFKKIVVVKKVVDF